MAKRVPASMRTRVIPPDRRVRQPDFPGHRVDRPVARVGQRRLQRPLGDLGHLAWPINRQYANIPTALTTGSRSQEFFDFLHDDDLPVIETV